jgi:hypothetical protein
MTMTPEGGNFGFSFESGDPLARQVLDEVDIGTCRGCGWAACQLTAIQREVDHQMTFAKRRLSEDRLTDEILGLFGKDIATYTEEELREDPLLEMARFSLRQSAAESLEKAAAKTDSKLRAVQEKCQDCPGPTIIEHDIGSGIIVPEIRCNNLKV